MLRAVVLACLAECAQTARIQVQQGLNTQEEWKWRSKKKVVWKLICNGYLKGSYLGRKGHGSHPVDFVEEKPCKEACQEIDGCNLVTYDTTSGKCWLETVPPQERKVLEAMPRANDCDYNPAAQTFWRGDPMETSGHEEIPEGWHLFCNGYVSDKSAMRIGFGAAKESNLGKGGCMEACAKKKNCNFVTYDRLDGKCWMEHLKHVPEHCDDNSAGWSYAMNIDQEIEQKETEKERMEDDSGDGWHFICTGFVTGKYEGRTGFGQALEHDLGHAGCKKACDEIRGCNFVTYDTWSGACWMERIPVTPDICDKNTAGWSYWKGVIVDE